MKGQAIVNCNACSFVACVGRMADKDSKTKPKAGDNETSKQGQRPYHRPTKRSVDEARIRVIAAFSELSSKL